MEALKFIGWVIILIIGFGLIVGVGAVSAVFSFIVVGIMLIIGIIIAVTAGLLESLRKRKSKS